ncbi:MAG TPA: Na/Pi symporter [Acidimicrobiia bacterium]|nr:Na/Pi symporter [Acidimicrobiia bacterium]
METATGPGRRRTTTVWLRGLAVVGFLFLFLVGVKSLETGINAFGADVAERLFDMVASPIAALSAGILATVLVQSSSVSTATIVGLVGSGALTLGTAVPMIMGANIGTTVTNTLASLGHIRQGQEFRRAFAGATIHDFFNVIAVILLLPLELLTGFLSRSAAYLTEVFTDGKVSSVSAPGSSPIKDAIGFPIGLVSDLLDSMAAASVLRGIVFLVFGLGLIFLALSSITRNMRLLMAGRIEASLNAMLGKGAGIGAMVAGMLITISVQSSSITTSVLIPLVAAGILTLENAYPVTLGANVGTTITALLASVAADRPEALTIALTHTLFNLTGILILYPVPRVRNIPIRLARRLAEVAQEHKQLVFVYVIVAFIVLPLAGMFFF